MDSFAAGDWVCTCTEGLEDVTASELASLGATDARVVGDGLVLASRAPSFDADAVLAARCVDTLGVLVGALTLTGAETDLDAFKTLCHPTLGAWGDAAPARWSVAAAAWRPAREAAVARHRMHLGQDREGPIPDPDACLWPHPDHPLDRPRVHPSDGRLRRDSSSRDRDEGERDRHRDASAAASESSGTPRPSSLVPTFRAHCTRTPGSVGGGLRHRYTSVRVAAALGWSVGAARPSWRVNLERPSLTVDAECRGAVAVVGLRVASCSDARRMRDCGSTATTRPHLAAAMIRLVAPRAGETAVDLACGAGTIMAEFVAGSARSAPPGWAPGSAPGWAPVPRYALGGDVDPASAASAAGTNLEASANPRASRVRHDVCAWRFERLPLRDGCVDVVACDLPFGKVHSDARETSRTYPRVLRETARVLRVGGRAALLGTRSRFNNALSSLPLEITFQRLVDKGGIKVALLILERVEEEAWARRRDAGEVETLLRKKRHDAARLARRAELARERAARLGLDAEASAKTAKGIETSCGV